MKMSELKLAVGQPAYIIDAYDRPLPGAVRRITPSGQVVVAFKTSDPNRSYELRFDANGYEMGSDTLSKYRRGQLVTAFEYGRHIETQKRQQDGRKLTSELVDLDKLALVDTNLPAKLEDLAKRLREWQLAK